LDEFITLNEAAELIGIDRSAFYRWSKTDKIKLYKKGAQTLVKRSDIEKIKAERETIRPID